MPDYAALASTAKALIDGAGRQVTIVRLATAPADPAKPWRGPANPRAPALVEVPGKMAFVPLGGSDLGIKFQATEVGPHTQVGLFPAEDDQGQPLEEFDEIVDGGARWRIVETQVLKPGDLRLLYAFLVQQ